MTRLQEFLFRCRSNTLNLNDRKRFLNEQTKCVACKESYEDLEHFILYCPLNIEVRSKSFLFHQPYPENWLGHLLFDENINKEEVKITLNEFWKRREKLIKSIQ